jgi:opacity protein-like surface antigen
LTDTDTIVEGAAFLDGDPNDGDPDLQALIRFDSIFAADGGPVPDDAEIVNASLIVTTASCEFSTNSATDEEFVVRTILNDWDGNTPFSSLSLGPIVDVEFGLIQDALAKYDVTSVVQGIQSGDDNFGFNLQVTDTFGGTNGWAIEVSTSPLAPQLKITYLSEGGCDFEVGDVNQDGGVSLLDVDPFVTLLTAGTFQCEADINGDGSVTLLDVDPFVLLLTGG